MKRYALSVGISKYNSNILADLHKPASDAEAVAHLIAACRSREKAYEGEKYSIFTEALLKGLAEDNAGNDGKISSDRLRYHPVFQDPQTDIEKQACEICRKWVWER